MAGPFYLASYIYYIKLPPCYDAMAHTAACIGATWPLQLPKQEMTRIDDADVMRAAEF